MDGSVEKSIENKAKEKANEIVQITSENMILEDQKNYEKRLSKAIREKTIELINEMPRYLWD